MLMLASAVANASLLCYELFSFGHSLTICWCLKSAALGRLSKG